MANAPHRVRAVGDAAVDSIQRVGTAQAQVPTATTPPRGTEPVESPSPRGVVPPVAPRSLKDVESFWERIAALDEAGQSKAKASASKNANDIVSIMGEMQAMRTRISQETVDITTRMGAEIDEHGRPSDATLASYDVLLSKVEHLVEAEKRLEAAQARRAALEAEFRSNAKQDAKADSSKTESENSVAPTVKLTKTLGSSIEEAQQLAQAAGLTAKQTDNRSPIETLEPSHSPDVALRGIHHSKGE